MKEWWANSGGFVDLLIWIFVAILWGVAQLVQSQRKRRSAPGHSVPEPPPLPGEQASPDSLREFLQSLSGGADEPLRPRPVPSPPKQEPGRVPQPPPPPKHVRKKAPRTGPPPQLVDVLPIREGKKTAAVLAGKKSDMPSIAKGYLVNLSGVRTPHLPRIPIPQLTAGSGGRLGWMQNHDPLRRGMVARYILGPPVALLPPRAPGEPAP